MHIDGCAEQNKTNAIYTTMHIDECAEQTSTVCILILYKIILSYTVDSGSGPTRLMVTFRLIYRAVLPENGIIPSLLRLYILQRPLSHSD